MMMNSIKYKSGYKYHLAEAYYIHTPFQPTRPVFHEYITLSADGDMCIFAGYAWDGPSGPALDTKSAMRGSLVHDAGYELLRRKMLPEETRKQWDIFYHDICVEDGMWRWRAVLHFNALRLFGQPAADPANDNPVQVAP